MGIRQALWGSGTHSSIQFSTYAYSHLHTAAESVSGRTVTDSQCSVGKYVRRQRWARQCCHVPSGSHVRLMNMGSQDTEFAFCFHSRQEYRQQRSRISTKVEPDTALQKDQGPASSRPAPAIAARTSPAIVYPYATALFEAGMSSTGSPPARQKVRRILNFTHDRALWSQICIHI